MHIGTGQIDEIFTEAGRAARITCDPNLVPAPGQYLLAHAPSEPEAPLPQPVFLAASQLRGFYAARPLPVSWTPGTPLILRGPLGRGFRLPAYARRVALAAFGGNPSRLMALLEPALAQKAEITLLADTSPDDLPPAIESLPLNSLPDTITWADYLVIDAPRATLTIIHEMLFPASRPSYPDYTPSFATKPLPVTKLTGCTMDILIETPLPCGGMAECGACALQTRQGYRLACKDGPVFDLKSIL